MGAMGALMCIEIDDERVIHIVYELAQRLQISVEEVVVSALEMSLAAEMDGSTRAASAADNQKDLPSSSGGRLGDS